MATYLLFKGIKEKKKKEKKGYILPSGAVLRGEGTRRWRKAGWCGALGGQSAGKGSPGEKKTPKIKQKKENKK